MPTPKSTASRRAIAFGLKTAGASEEQFQATAYKADDAPRLLAPGARDADRSVRADPLLFEASAESGSDR